MKIKVYWNQINILFIDKLFILIKWVFKKNNNPYRNLLGSWEGYYDKSPICLKIHSVDGNGDFMAQVMTPGSCYSDA